ncbi:carotenoid biosynthesis protein [Winogradskyella sp. PE311]|uniref:carotenoid biosynthesis protein n=1 Tax=Winogradskyella sp. PE311 TaxID=3366943 RepID=UPI003980D201
MINWHSKYHLHLSIVILWLFHGSAIIGISLGFSNWFIEKTPLNLTVSLLLFLFIYSLNSFKKIGAFLLFFSLGLFAEWLGVNYQLLFGSYYYGNNFGVKLDGVPYLIGIYWALLTFVTAAILDYTKWHRIVKIVLAALFMVFLDFVMEFSAPILDFWHFEGGMPKFENYFTWFLLGIIFQYILKQLKIEGNKLFCLNLYVAQLIFFLFAYFYF